MVSENEFKKNKNTTILASIILDDFYSGVVLKKNFNYGCIVPDYVNQKDVYQIDLYQFNRQKTGLENVLETFGKTYFNSFDFNDLNEPLLKDILKKSINVENIVIKNGILSLI